MPSKAERWEAYTLLPEKQEEQKLLRELDNMRIPTAAYIRLSLEGDDSLENQKKLVQEYIENSPDLKLIDTYIDNGLTGTNFDRPGWSRLMLDVQQGRINAIVVKDLSRFGRHYVETGTYLTKIFPKLGVRLIAITDGFDSANPTDMDHITIPVKNVANYYYAKDMSDKIHKVLNEKKKRGEVLGLTAFGYFREAGNKLRIDEETAPVIRMMYRWVAMGVELAEIATRLNLMVIPSPRGKAWNDGRLRYLLENPVYCGDFITGKWITNMHRVIKVDKESWLVFKEHHEGIVSKELWIEAQKKLQERDWKYKGKQVGRRDKPLDGLLFCATCGRSLIFDRQKDLCYCQWHTGTHQKNSDTVPLLKRPLITVNELIAEVFTQGQDYLNWVAEVRRKLKSEYGGTNGGINGGTNGGVIGMLKRKSIELMRQKKKTEESMTRLYSDYQEGTLDTDTFTDAAEKLAAARKQVEKDIEAVMMEQRQAQTCYDRVQNYIETVYGMKLEEWDEKKIRHIVERVNLEPNGTVRIDFFFQNEMKMLIGEDEEDGSREDGKTEETA